jgi:hypothetical protein
MAPRNVGLGTHAYSNPRHFPTWLLNQLATCRSSIRGAPGVPAGGASAEAVAAGVLPAKGHVAIEAVPPALLPMKL